MTKQKGTKECRHKSDHCVVLHLLTEDLQSAILSGTLYHFVPLDVRDLVLVDRKP